MYDLNKLNTILQFVSQKGKIKSCLLLSSINWFSSQFRFCHLVSNLVFSMTPVLSNFDPSVFHISNKYNGISTIILPVKGCLDVS